MTSDKPRPDESAPLAVEGDVLPLLESARLDRPVIAPAVSLSPDVMTGAPGGQDEGAEESAPDPEAVRRSLEALEALLHNGPREYSRKDLAETFGIPQRLTALYWRSLGFAGLEADVPAFTEEDSYAIGDLAALVEEGLLAEDAFANISRGLGFHMGRLAMWLTEAFVEEAKHEGGLSDPYARLAMIERLPQLLDSLEDQVLYVFRRELSAYAARAASEVLRASENGPDELFPLLRAVGFVDLVQFTKLSREVTGEELADIISRFEALGRDIVSVGGGRVVKTVGDEIMFLADTAADGAQIAVSLAERIAADDSLPQARVGLAWGAMFSLYGDVYGPTVNLAARLESSALPGEVWVDDATASAVERARPGDFIINDAGELDLAGIGPVMARVLGRGDSAPLSLSL